MLLFSILSLHLVATTFCASVVPDRGDAPRLLNSGVTPAHPSFTPNSFSTVCPITWQPSGSASGSQTAQFWLHPASTHLSVVESQEQMRYSTPSPTFVSTFFCLRRILPPLHAALFSSLPPAIFFIAALHQSSPSWMVINSFSGSVLSPILLHRSVGTQSAVIGCVVAPSTKATF